MRLKPSDPIIVTGVIYTSPVNIKFSPEIEVKVHVVKILL